MNHTRRRLLQKGFSLIELLIVISIILIIVTIAVPKFEKMLMNTREMAAIQAIRTIHAAQVQYYSQFNRNAATLAELGPPPNGQAGPSGADLIPADLAKGVKQGYLFKMDAKEGGYLVHADPESFNGTGRRSFFSDQSQTIHQNWGSQPATASSPEL